MHNIGPGGITDSTRESRLFCGGQEVEQSTNIPDVIASITTNQEHQHTLSQLDLNFFWSNGIAVAELARSLSKAEVAFIILHQKLAI
jgi:hypothetical protein